MTRFRNCTLKTCDFRGVNIKAGYFEDCKWDQCDFQGADLTECIFFEDDIPFLHLDADQLQVILLIGGRRNEVFHNGAG